MHEDIEREARRAEIRNFLEEITRRCRLIHWPLTSVG